MDTRTCERCSHLRSEHRHGNWIANVGFCWCCDCPEFIPEPDDISAPSTTPEEVA